MKTTPRETVPLHGIIPAGRKLEGDYTTCRKSCEKFSSGSTKPRQTCYTHTTAYKEYCWSNDVLDMCGFWHMCSPHPDGKWTVVNTTPSPCADERRSYECTPTY